MAGILVTVGLILAVLLLVTIPKVPGGLFKGLTALLAALVLALFFSLASVRYVQPDEVGIVYRNALGPSLKEGRIIAVDGEMGIQADVLSPGWHFWYWPVIYDVRTVPLTTVGANEVGLVEARDGRALPDGQLFAPEVPALEFKKLVEDARYFLTQGGGYRGAQASVLKPGKYRINTELFNVSMTTQTEVVAGEVAVLTANFGSPASVVVHGPAGLPGPGAEAPPGAPPVATPSAAASAASRAGESSRLRLADEGQMGVRAQWLNPGRYDINPAAYKVTEIWTTQMIAHYTAGHSGTPTSQGTAVSDEREITVRTSDGFTFPVDVRIEYHVKPEDAPLVVAKLGDDEGERFRNQLNSAVRAEFRNAAENVRALDYVQLRSQQEQQVLTNLARAMAPFGLSITGVRIGNVGDERTLGALLKTQTDRELAKQEQVTLQEQQRAAEQRKELARITQEAEEEKRLATAAYAVKVAEEESRRRIIEAQAEAESIRIRAESQAKAFQSIALQIGKGNAALIELLKIVGERNIQITPRVMVTGMGQGPGAGLAGSAETTALIGTMLDTMMQRDDPALNTPPAPSSSPAPAPPPAGSAAPASTSATTSTSTSTSTPTSGGR